VFENPDRLARIVTRILIGWNVAGAALAAIPVIDEVDWHRAEVDLQAGPFERRLLSITQAAYTLLRTNRIAR
jgi:hypothetical protein